MSELRERLQEAAEAAAREGQIPSTVALVERGRRRRRRLIEGTAALVALAVVGGVLSARRLADQPMPLTPTPTAGPTPTVGLTSTTIPTKATVSPRGGSLR